MDRSAASTASAPLRALMVCRSLPCHVRGGLEFHVLDLAAGLAREGLRVELLTAAVPAAYRAELEGLGLTVHEIRGVRADRYSLAWLRRVGGHIDALIRSRGFDAIHGQEFALGLWRPPRDFSGSVVVTVHGTITTETPLHPDVYRRLTPGGKLRAWMRFGRRLVYAPVWRAMLRRADAVLVDSHFTAAEMIRTQPRIVPRLRRVPLGVETARHPAIDAAEARRELGWPPPGEGPAMLITVGRLEWQKGHDLAIRALAGLRDLDWRYCIVGEGGRADELRALIERLGLGDRAILTGRVDERRKALMLAGADLFLWPERTHPAFGLAGLEALLMNTPALGANRGAIPEVVDSRSGRIFPADDPRALAAALRELLADRPALTALSRGLRERTLERFDPDAMIRGTAAVYRELTQTRGRRR